MAKSATDIVERALTLIDEQLTEFTSVATTEMSVREIGLEILPEVCRDLVKELPYELKRYLSTTSSLTAESLSGGESQTYTKRKIALVAPSDFWELVSLRMNVWSRPVTSYILIDSEEYAIQNNPFTRSGKQNPTVAVSSNVDGTGARIECFSIEDGDSILVDNFQYISFNNVPDDLENNWPDELFDEVTKALASQLEVIKDRIEKGMLRGEEATAGIEQHGL